MIHHTLVITLVLEGPVLTGSTAPGEPGVDAPMARNAQGCFMLPRSLVKGRLREAWEELRSATNGEFAPAADELLGASTGNQESEATSVEPARGRLDFSDFVCDARPSPKTRHRIQVDDRRGAAAEGALLVMEAPFASGAEARFRGVLDYWTRTAPEGEALEAQVLQGLHWVTHFGGERSVGFGRLLKIESESRQASPEVAAAVTGAPPGAFSLTLRPLAPFCLAGHRETANLFESETVIPGAAIKGALAETWGRMLGAKPGTPVRNLCDAARPALQRQFDQIVFSHVFPSPETRKARPVQPPLSLVKVRGRSGWHDLALVGQPVLLHGLAPAFRMDWKDTEDVDKAFGWESPRREMRVRTAVNGQRRKAADEQLFAYEMVVPDGFLWHGRVDFSQIEDEQERTAAASQLKSLMELGLSALGKTKTGAKVVLDDEGAVPPFIGSSAEGRDSRWVVTLQTPALMSDPRELTGMDREQRLRAGYEAYWHDLLGGVFELEHFYARQKLAGGFYLWKRFSPMTPYSPYLLTEAGSVFVLRSTRPELAVPRIRDWLRHGLPLPRWAVERYAAEGRPGNHWQNCPYIPQNGYGEIAVNLAAHWNDGPKPEQMEVIHVL